MDEFDTSAFSSEHPLFHGMTSDKIKTQKLRNKKVPGKMKDELDGNTLLEFIGLRAKSYAFRQRWTTLKVEKLACTNFREKNFCED